jgi:hypothetical protein
VVAGGVQVRWDGETAGLAGLLTCGSVWLCSVCNAKVMARRSLELGLILSAAAAQGRWLGLMTFTLRHHAGDGLTPLWDDLTGSVWREMTRGRPWSTDKARFGVEGYIRATEVTWGEVNGWHPHLHVPVIGDRSKMTTERLRDLHESMVGRWTTEALRLGRRAPLMRGQDARLIHGAEGLADYLMKASDWGQAVGAGDAGLGAEGPSGPEPETGAAPRVPAGTTAQQRAIGLGREVTQSQGKQARTALSTVTPWTILDRIIEDGDADALDVWHEYERAVKAGRRHQISKSRGLAQLVGLDLVEKTDEEVATEELGSSLDTVFTIDNGPDGWGRFARDPILHPQLLQAFQHGRGLAGALTFCRDRGIAITIA